MKKIKDIITYAKSKEKKSYLMRMSLFGIFVYLSVFYLQVRNFGKPKNVADIFGIGLAFLILVVMYSFMLYFNVIFYPWIKRAVISMPVLEHIYINKHGLLQSMFTAVDDASEAFHNTPVKYRFKKGWLGIATVVEEDTSNRFYKTSGQLFKHAFLAFFKYFFSFFLFATSFITGWLVVPYYMAKER